MSEADRKFDPIQDPVEQLSLLREAAKSFSTTMIWTKSQSHSLTCHMSVFSEADGVMYFSQPKDFDQRSFVEEIARSGSRDLFFSVSLPKANIFFKAFFLGYDGGLKFKIPTQIFKVQRRSHLRLPIPDGYKLKVEFADPLFPENKLVKNIIDISAGGAAVVVSKEESPMFQSGLVVHEFKFSIRGKEMSCSAEVRHASPHRVNNIVVGTKVGVLFKNLPDPDMLLIQEYVFDETRKQFQTMMKD